MNIIFFRIVNNLYTHTIKMVRDDEQFLVLSKNENRGTEPVTHTARAHRRRMPAQRGRARRATRPSSRQEAWAHAPGRSAPVPQLTVDSKQKCFFHHRKTTTSEKINFLFFDLVGTSAERYDAEKL